MYYEIGEGKGAAATKSEAIAPVPAASTAPAAPEGTEGKVSFIHKKIVGPVKVWHVGAGVGAGIIGYIAYRMLSRPSYY